MNKANNEPDTDFTIGKLDEIGTLAELEAALGPITPEEQALLDSMGSTITPTQEEIDQFDRDYPNFTRNFMLRFIERHPEFEELARRRHPEWFT